MPASRHVRFSLMWPAVELRELRVFLAVAEELHFGRAAERLQIDRSRVSQIISTLEVRVGGRLFDRTSRQVQLTPIGERLRASIAPAYEQLVSAFEDVRETATGVAGTLRIGLDSPISAGRHVVNIVRTFRRWHPDADVAFTSTGWGRSYLDVLRAGEVDMLAIRLPLSEPDITIGPVLSHEERALVVARHDPLAERESVSLEELADRHASCTPAFPHETMDALVPPVTPDGRTLRRVANHDVEETLMRVALGEQVHLTVRSFLEYHAHPRLKSIPIADMPASETALAWLSANNSPKIHAFLCAAGAVLIHTELAAHQPPEVICHAPAKQRALTAECEPILA
jgi:DNA-binding transcriptional LysR family regulator